MAFQGLNGKPGDILCFSTTATADTKTEDDKKSMLKRRMQEGEAATLLTEVAHPKLAIPSGWLLTALGTKSASHQRAGGPTGAKRILSIGMIHCELNWFVGASEGPDVHSGGARFQALDPSSVHPKFTPFCSRDDFGAVRRSAEIGFVSRLSARFWGSVQRETNEK